MIIEHMASGLSFESFGAVIDVNVDTLYQWNKLKPQFAEAKSIAFEKCRLFWEKKGIEGLHTSNYRKGNTSITKSINAHIWSLNMKARFKEWRNVDKPEETDTVNPTQLIIHVKQD